MFFNVQAHIANYYNTFALLVNILRCVGENFNNKLFLLLCFLFFSSVSLFTDTEARMFSIFGIQPPIA